MMSVAPEPMVRMELTASPISRSRESTTPSMGETMVALRRSSSARVSTRLRLLRVAPRLWRWRLATRPDWRRRLLAVRSHLVLLFGFVASRAARSTAGEQRAGSFHVALEERHIGSGGVDFVALVIGLGAVQRGFGDVAAPPAPGAPAAAGRSGPVRRSPVPADYSPTLTGSFWMMPLALDLISTLVAASILPWRRPSGPDRCVPL